MNGPVTSEDLSRAGVGLRYRDTKLSNMERQGSVVLSWITNHLDAALEAGDGLTLTGGSYDGIVIVNALTRALVHCGVRCQLIDLLDVAAGLQEDFVPGEDTVVLVSNFYVSGFAKNPLPTADVMQVERYISERIDARASTFIHATAGPDSWTAWWSELLVARLVAVNVEVKV